MKERPILFSAPMVRAILEGRKTQTRRVVKPQPDAKYTRLFYDPAWFWSPTTSGSGGEQQDIQMVPRCPYGVPGDRLWVKETFAALKSCLEPCSIKDATYAILSDGTQVRRDGTVSVWKKSIPEVKSHFKWRPSIHMPRWASRITLEVVSVRVEKLQQISDRDAFAEGIEMVRGPQPASHGVPGLAPTFKHYTNPHFKNGTGIGPADSYRTLWESINGPDSWDANPWVWVVGFKRIKP